MIEDIDLTKVPAKAPRCLECNRRAVLSDASSCYPNEPELHNRPMWVCECGAFASCVRGTLIPRYRPSNAETRRVRYDAYKAIREWQASLVEGGASRWAARKAAGKMAYAENVPLRLDHAALYRMVRTLEVFSQKPLV